MSKGPLNNSYYPGIPLAQGMLDNAQTHILQGIAIVPTSATRTTIWSGPTALYVFPSDSGESMEVLSTNVADTQPALIIGLDANFDEVFLFVELTGTTPVILDTPLARVNDVVLLLNNPLILGEVSIRGAGAGTTYAVVVNGEGTAQQAVYTVPRGKTLSFIDAFFSIDQDSGANTGVVLRLLVRFPGEAEGLGTLKVGLNKAGTSAMNIPVTTGVNASEMTDLTWEANSTSNNTEVTVFVQCVLYDN